MATPGGIPRFPNIFSPATGAQATAAPPTRQTSNFFGSTAQPGFGLPMELVRAPASNVDDPAPSPQLMHRFAEALAHWTRNCAGQVTVASHLELLSTYEEIIHREIGRSSSELERSLLRGERSSWRLLRKIYENYEQKDVGSWEQYPPQDPPLPCADWGAELRELGREAGELRELGREAGELRELPPLDQSHALDRARQSHDGELSLVPASAGLRVRALHDERLLEEQLRRAEPQLELAEQLKQWLEEEAIERVEVVETSTTTIRHTKQRRREELRAADQPVSHLSSSLDPDAPFKEKKQLDPEDEAAQAELLRLLWQRVRAGKLDDAQALCRRSGQHWRAATLAGGEPYHYNPSERGWRGNPDRQLWKSACEKIAERAAQHRERGGAKHEAALYAALAASCESHELVLAGTLIAADCR
jgi:nuclear pore complex protein Nup107